MIDLQKLLGNEVKFYDLFEASAAQGCDSVRALREFLAQPAATRTLEAFAVSRRRDKSITAEINAALCASPVTALEREDIQDLSNSIYKIPKTIEKVAERLLLAPQHLDAVDLSPQVTMVEKTTALLLQMVQEMRKPASHTAARVKELNERLQAIEGEADKSVLEVLREIYNTPQEPGRAIFLKDIFELLEKVTDRCRDAGNVVSRIVLKGS